MLGLIAALLIVLWLLGFFAFHVTTGLIHIALVVGLILLVLHFVRGSASYGQNKEQKRLENSGVVMQEIMDIPDNIPQQMMENAKCVIVFPSVLKTAFVVGASYGRGAMVCRRGEEFKGSWGAPAMFALEGGSIGFQIGGKPPILFC